MKMKLFGGDAQTSRVLTPGILFTLVILGSNSVPGYVSGVKSFEKGDMPNVLIGLGPTTTFITSIHGRRGYLGNEAGNDAPAVTSGSDGAATAAGAETLKLLSAADCDGPSERSAKGEATSPTTSVS